MMLTTEAITEDGNQEFLSTKGRELGYSALVCKPVHEENKDHFLSVVQALVGRKLVRKISERNL